MIIPPRYAYSAIAALVIGIVVVLAVASPPQPQPRELTLEELTAKADRIEAEAAAMQRRAAEMSAEADRQNRRAAERLGNMTVDRFRQLHGDPSHELIDRCLDAGHSLTYCNRQ